jgi:hypothetical protein
LGARARQVGRLIPHSATGALQYKAFEPSRASPIALQYKGSNRCAR